MSSDYQINVDGASTPQQGRKGPAAAAIYVKRDKEFHHQESKFLNCTNSEAELYALYMAVKWAVDNTEPGDTVLILSDNQYVVHCFATKAQLAYLAHWQTTTYPELFAKIVKLWDHDHMTIGWVPRASNKDADKLAQSTKRRGY